MAKHATPVWALMEQVLESHGVQMPEVGSQKIQDDPMACVLAMAALAIQSEISLVADKLGELNEKMDDIQSEVGIISKCM